MKYPVQVITLRLGFGELADVREENWRPESFGLPPCDESELKGGDLSDNLKILDDLLHGRAPEGLLSTIAANAGAAFLHFGESRRCS